MGWGRPAPFLSHNTQAVWAEPALSHLWGWVPVGGWRKTVWLHEALWDQLSLPFHFRAVVISFWSHPNFAHWVWWLVWWCNKFDSFYPIIVQNSCVSATMKWTNYRQAEKTSKLIRLVYYICFSKQRSPIWNEFSCFILVNSLHFNSVDLW